jgi:DnaJ-class molecular chaperone
MSKDIVDETTACYPCLGNGYVTGVEQTRSGMRSFNDTCFYCNGSGVKTIRMIEDPEKEIT